MTKDSKFNWQVRGAALGIFLLGFVAGALALNAYHVWFSQSLSTTTTKQQRFDRIFDQLSLSEPQKAEVQKILGETREEYKNVKKEPDPRFDPIRNRADERFKKVFTPEQWETFESLRNSFREAEKANANK